MERLVWRIVAGEGSEEAIGCATMMDAEGLKEGIGFVPIKEGIGCMPMDGTCRGDVRPMRWKRSERGFIPLTERRWIEQCEKTSIGSTS